MNENDWLESMEPKAMFTHVYRQLDQRKQRLLACACIRSIWHNLHDERFRTLVELSEALADGRATIEQVDQAGRNVHQIDSQIEFPRVLFEPPLSAMVAAMSVCDHNVTVGFSQALKFSLLSYAPCCKDQVTGWPNEPEPTRLNVQARHLANLTRDIVGNPFQLVYLHPDWLAWNNGTVGQLAETIYEERRYQDLPVLADALEEAGCDDTEILDHLRGPGVHARGCWVLDLARGV